jgi:hypothetical protein
VAVKVSVVKNTVKASVSSADRPSSRAKLRQLKLV